MKFSIASVSAMLVALGTGVSALAMEEPAGSPGPAPAALAGGASSSSSSSSSSAAPTAAAHMAAALKWDLEHTPMFLGVDEGLILGDLMEVQAPVWMGLTERGGAPRRDPEGRLIIAPVSRVGTGALAGHPQGWVLYHVGRHYTVARLALAGERGRMVTDTGAEYVPITHGGADDLGRAVEVEVIPAAGNCLIQAIQYLAAGELPDEQRILELRAEVAARMSPERLTELAEEIMRDAIREVRPLLDSGCYAGLGLEFSRFLHHHRPFQEAYGAAAAQALAAQERAPAPRSPVADFGHSGTVVPSGPLRGGRGGEPALGAQGFRFTGADWRWSLDNREDGTSSMEIDLHGFRAQAQAAGGAVQSLSLHTRDGNLKAFSVSPEGAAEWARQFAAAVERRFPGACRAFQEQVDDLTPSLILHHGAGLASAGRERERAGLVLGYWDSARAKLGLDDLENLQALFRLFRNAGAAAGAGASGSSASRAAAAVAAAPSRPALAGAGSRTTFDLAALPGAWAGLDLGPFSLGRPEIWPLAGGRGAHCLVGTDTPGAADQRLLLLDASADSILGNPVLGTLSLGAEPFRQAGWVHPEMALVAAGQNLHIITVSAENTMTLHLTLPAAVLSAPMRAMAINPANRAQAVFSDGAHCAFIDLMDPDSLELIGPSGTAQLSSIAWPPFNQAVIPSTTLEDGTFRMFDVRQHPALLALQAHMGRAGLVAHARFGDHDVVMGFTDGAIQRLDVRVADRIMGAFHAPGAMAVDHLEFDAARNSLLVGGPGAWASYRLGGSGTPFELEYATGTAPGGAPPASHAALGLSGWILDCTGAGLYHLTELKGRPAGDGGSAR